MKALCQFCKGILGCPHLGNRHGVFIPEKVITEGNPKDCSDFQEIGDREKTVRGRLYALSGLGYLRALHELPNIMMEGLRQGEMYEDLPDFLSPSLLYKGMTTTEREEVLRYTTDKDGCVIVEVDSEGQKVKRHRPAYHLKQYAVNEDGPIQLDQSVGWFWTTNQLVDFILRTEVEQGLIVKEKKAKEANPKPPKQDRETEEMSEGKLVRVTRGGRGNAATGARKAAPKKPEAEGEETRISRGPRGPGRPPKVEGKRGPGRPPKAEGGASRGPGRPPGPRGASPKPPAETSAPSSGGCGSDIKALRSDITDLRAEILGLAKAVKEVQDDAIRAITALHDILVQTGGSLQFVEEDEDGNELYDENDNPVYRKCPQLGSHKLGILAYLDNAAKDIIFDPDYDEATGTLGESSGGEEEEEYTEEYEEDE